MGRHRHGPPQTPTPDPLPREYLISTWRTHKDPLTQTLLTEIARLHDVLRQAEDLRQTIAAELARHPGGQLVAAYHLRSLLIHEPALQGRPRMRVRAMLNDAGDSLG